MTTRSFFRSTMKRIILLEAAPHWEPEMRRRISGLDESLIPCRSLQQVRDKLKTDPDNIIVCAMFPISGELLLLFSEALEQRTTAGIIVLRRNEDAELEWNLREIGVAAVLPDRYESATELERYCRILGKSDSFGTAVR